MLRVEFNGILTGTNINIRRVDKILECNIENMMKNPFASSSDDFEKKYSFGPMQKMDEPFSAYLSRAMKKTKN